MKEPISKRESEYRQMLADAVKYAREDRMVTPGFTRLARLLAKADEAINTCDVLPMSSALPYIAACEDAERRAKQGQAQAHCTTCQKWRWPNEQKACPRFAKVQP